MNINIFRSITRMRACKKGVLYGLVVVCAAVLVSCNEYSCDNGTAQRGFPSAASIFCVACDDGYQLVDNSCQRQGAYTCDDGTATSGNPPGTGNVAQCARCNDGYHLEGITCVANTYTCAKGDKADPGTRGGVADEGELCASCIDGYHIEGNGCAINEYMCANGMPVTQGTPGANNGEIFCATCDDTYLLTADNACDNDLDGDDFLNAVDVDDDNDGLIEIHNLDMFRNIDYNFDGTSYDDENDDSAGNEGDTTGGPTKPTANCDTATNGVYLCGYELTRSLDFADGASYASGEVNTAWRPTRGDPPTVTDPATATNVGWPGVSDTNVPGNEDFHALIEGNGYTISNLYRRARYAALFNAIYGTVRNLGVLNVAIYSPFRGAGLATNLGDGGTIINCYTTGAITSTGLSSSNPYYFGGLVAEMGAFGGSVISSIIASYSTATVTNNGGLFNNAGGLVGIIFDGAITASYATGAVNGGTGGTSSFIGGLVGQIEVKSTIIASYATGDVTGTDGNGDYVGGLVGYHDSGSIIASYATGDVSDSDGDNDRVGGLIGLQKGGTITASYATGNATDNSGDGRNVDSLIGSRTGGRSTASYGFGDVEGDGDDPPVISPPENFAATAATLQIDDPDTVATYAGDVWNNPDNDTLNAWDVGNDTDEPPALRYADYDGEQTGYNCSIFPATIPGTTTPIECNSTLLPGQRE